MSDLQYLRAISLVVTSPGLTNQQARLNRGLGDTQSVSGEVSLDLSQLRIKFSTKQTDGATPNTSVIRVYNLEDATAQRIKKEFKSVLLQAGYESNFGVIFKGNIYQVIIGRESATETFIDIVAGDGDRAYNYAIVNQTIAAGCTTQDQVSAALLEFQKKGVNAGHLGEFPTQQLPRGKVMYGQAKNYLSTAAETSDKTWTIQNEQLIMIPLKSYLPGDVVEINSDTGMIGSPQQTNIGVNFKCLLNPRIKMGTRCRLNNSSIQGLQINLNVNVQSKDALSNLRQLTPAALTTDGVYYAFTMEHQGDTRGTEWYTSVICATVNPTDNPANSVGLG